MIKIFSYQGTPNRQHPGLGRYRRRFLFFFIAVVLLLGLPAISFLFGILNFPSFKVAFNPIVRTTGIDWTNRPAVVQLVFDSLRNAPMNFVRAHLSGSVTETINIDIKFKNFEKLIRKRNEALKKGFLEANDDDFVPARLRVGKKNVRVKLRLKGDLLDHLGPRKWSFRLHTKDDGHLFGMRRFSIHAPKTRNYHLEALFLDHLRKEGVLAPRYFVVNTIRNGDDIGLMALEEGFSKELIESQKRRDGVIIKFDTHASWRFRMRYPLYKDPYVDSDTLEILPFRLNRVNRSEKLQSDYYAAVGLLRGFIDGRLVTSDVFDVRLLARYLAISMVWGARHGLVIDNNRFYLNPLTMLLEPVGYDAKPDAFYKKVPTVPLNETIYHKVFKDPKFREIYLSESHRISKDVLSAQFGRWVDERETHYLNVLHKETPIIPSGIRQTLEKRAKDIASYRLEDLTEGVYESRSSTETDDRPWPPKSLEYSKYVSAFLVKRTGRYAIEIVNLVSKKIIIENIFLDGIEIFGTRTPDGSPVGFPFVLAPKAAWGKKSSVLLVPNFDPRIIPTETMIEIRPEGAKRNRFIKPRRYSLSPEQRILPPGRLDEILKSYPFIRFDKNLNVLVIQSGRWQITENLILPEGVGLSIAAGTELRMSKGVFILLRGPLDIHGLPNTPVVFQAASPDAQWGGIAVIRSAKPSFLSNAVFRDLSGIKNGAWSTTGAMTFYQSDSTIEASHFEDVSAEDALNIVRSNFKISGTRFQKVRSDAVDVDYGKGSISKSIFDTIGGDGIDISGSEVLIEDIRLSDVRDKGVSVGERSSLRARNVNITKAGSAVVTKDGSVAELEGIVIAEIKNTALMVYKKKLEYGPARMVAKRVKFNNVYREAVAQDGSELIYNGHMVEPVRLDVRSLYYDGNLRKNAE